MQLSIILLAEFSRKDSISAVQSLMNCRAVVLETAQCSSLVHSPRRAVKGCFSVEWDAQAVHGAVMPYLPDQDAQLPLASLRCCARPDSATHAVVGSRKES